MRRTIPFLIVALILLGCHNHLESNSQKYEDHNLEGDLYYTWLKVGSFYNFPDSLYQNYVSLRDSIGIDELKNENIFGSSQIEVLEKYNLIKSPYIYLKTDADSTYVVYMSKKNFKPFTKFVYNDLISSNQKIRIQMVGN